MSEAQRQHEPRETDYTPAEQARAVRKVDFLVLPMIVFCFLMLQFDRTNLGNAQTDRTFLPSLGITTANINIGQTLFTLGFVIFELPSNMVSKAIGPQRWVPFIVFTWGLITLCQAFLTNRGGFYGTRFLLASGEAGFIPGMAWYITRFYKNSELSLRLAIFWAANSLAGMVSGPLALGILRGLEEKRGWHGWQWLFIIEGTMTMFVATIAFLYLPSVPTDGGRSLLFPILSSRDAEILSARLLSDDSTKALGRGEKVTFGDIKDTCLDWRLWGHCAAAFLSSIILTPINTYGPRVIQSLGYSGFIANGMSAPASAIGLVFSVSLAYSSDRFAERGIHIFVAMALSCAGCLWLALAPDDVGKRVLYGGYLMAAGTMGCGQAINASWLSHKFDERRRPIALAFYVAFIQMAGFAGSNVFKPGDAPRYKNGLIICGVCALAGGVVMLVWKALYVWDEKRNVARNGSEEEDDGAHVESYHLSRDGQSEHKDVDEK
ncbi:tartrate transporter [Cryptococcus wingfieldii CBS 7118]|uniref:Tartrate transporter n=1 Tax=Cryptococcus wingfieldii CBS 7118 TaxID=1295528 RepID=A0A1E3JLR0_9TREE|nr:tartrate transporter [Cryptococcus wingfieldii CBS 7118]ODO01805.1 tartrate transporter [Cryptococcus wingfieldii CBS 7118]